METFLRLSKIYRWLLSIVSFFTFAMVGAGSHSGINFENKETRLIFLAIGIYILTVISSSVFVKSKVMKPMSTVGFILIIFTSASIVMAGYFLFSLVMIDLDNSSASPFLSILVLLSIVILGGITLKKLVALGKK